VIVVWDHLKSERRNYKPTEHQYKGYSDHWTNSNTDWVAKPDAEDHNTTRNAGRAAKSPNNTYAYFLRTKWTDDKVAALR
jgi:hypothetical protein